MSDVPRTVADVTRDVFVRFNQPWWSVLGIDPDMPYDQFRRLLAIGERVEKLDHRYSDLSDDWRLYFETVGWNGCLDHIRNVP